MTDQSSDPTVAVGEARVFAEAALRMLTEGETFQAAWLLMRAALHALEAAA